MICLELLGMSRAGKTTHKNKLVKLMDDNQIETIGLSRPKIPFSEFDSAYHFHRFLIDYYNQEIDKNKDKDLIIIDRGFYDRSILLHFDYEHGQISDSKYNLLNNELKSLRNKVDCGFVFMIDPRKSLVRLPLQRLKGRDYSYLNKGLIDGEDLKGLSRLYELYDNLLKETTLKRIEGTNPIKINSNRIIEGVRCYGL